MNVTLVHKRLQTRYFIQFNHFTYKLSSETVGKTMIHHSASHPPCMLNMIDRLKIYETVTLCMINMINRLKFWRIGKVSQASHDDWNVKRMIMKRLYAKWVSLTSTYKQKIYPIQSHHIPSELCNNRQNEEPT